MKAAGGWSHDSESSVRWELQKIASAIASTPGLPAELKARLASLFDANYPRPYRNPRAGRTVLYRHFDADDVLLYAGIAEDFQRRVRQHDLKSLWSIFEAKAVAEWFPTRDAALKAELMAIEYEDPIFNLDRAKGGRPERVKDYLIKQQAWQFLSATI